MKVKSEVIKLLVISEELEISLVKQSQGMQEYYLVLKSGEWSKEIPLAVDLGKAAMTFVRLSDKFKSKYQQDGLVKFKSSIENVENPKLTKEQAELFYEIVSGGKSRVLH